MPSSKLMRRYYENDLVKIYHGTCLDILPSLNNATAIVTDPPYELGFMGKSWDSRGVSFEPETWQIVRNACLPGAPLLSFGGTRTFHRIACAIEDAGWEIRDTLMWVYGSGFPKSLDIGKAIDKLQGNEREDLGKHPNARETLGTVQICKKNGTGRLTKGNTIWEGYGTALKPAYEPIILAMNPLDGTFANNALKHGVAGLNIDECRIPLDRYDKDEYIPNRVGYKDGIEHRQLNTEDNTVTYKLDGNAGTKTPVFTNKGRFPANFIHDGSQMVMGLFPTTGQPCGSVKKTKHTTGMFGIGQPAPIYTEVDGDNHSAARFFYRGKATREERDRGCEEMYWLDGEQIDKELWTVLNDKNEQNKDNKAFKRHKIGRGNIHPTVKVLALMEYLCKLVKYPEHNLIIDPFMGSGTTLLACIRLGIPCIGIDNDEAICEIAARRCIAQVDELIPI